MCLYSNEIMQKDLKQIIEYENISFFKLKNKCVLITGATGMLAYYITSVLMYLNETKDYNINVVAIVRNENKAKKKFNCFKNNKFFKFIVQDICDNFEWDLEVDYIVHTAGNSNPSAIKNTPVDIIMTNTLGTINILNFARKKNVTNILFTSTREIYGKIDGIDVITEEDMGCLDPLDSRSCYPESKRAAEQLFKSYNIQFGIPYNIVRIAHSYGPGMQIENDGRVMSDFMSDLVNNRNIIMKSEGLAKRAFCYVTDAVAAMFLVMINGNNNEVYNIANETEEYAIKDVAEMMINIFPEKKIHVEYVIQSNDGKYCNYKRVALSTDKLEKLGFKPHIGLREGISRTVKSFEK